MENLVSLRLYGKPSPSTIPTDVTEDVVEQRDALLILILLDVSNSVPRGAWKETFLSVSIFITPDSQRKMKNVPRDGTSMETEEQSCN